MMANQPKPNNLSHFLSAALSYSEVEPDVEAARSIIGSCLDKLRSSPLTGEEGMTAISQLLAWLKLSHIKALPPDMEPRHIAGPELIDKIERLDSFVRNQENELWNVALHGMSHRFRAFDTYTTSELISRLTSGLVKGIGYRAFADALLSDGWNQHQFYSLVPHEVAQLAIALLDLKEKDSVYCPFVGSLPVAMECARRVQPVYVEMPTRDELVASILVLAGAEMEVEFSDPIVAPSFTDGRRLRLFDTSFACGSFNVKRSLPDFDFFGRFHQRMAFSDVVDAQHIISQTRRRAISVVPNGLLTRNGVAERQFREEIAKSGILKAVIALPEGLLSTTTIPINLLVFDKQEPSNSVKFIDARSAEFVESRKERRAPRNKLIGIEKISRLFHQYEDSSGARRVDLEECRRQDFDLSVSRYIVSHDLAVFHDALKSRQQRTLEEVTSMIVRGQSAPPGEDDVQMLFYEVGAADIGPDGIVRTPQKDVLVDERDTRGAFSKQVLRPGDIVMAVKGSVGTVGLVEEDALSPEGVLVPMIRVKDGEDVTMSGNVLPTNMPTNWIVGQSYVLIRANEHIDPIVLFMYLRSKVAQSWIKAKSTGTTVPNLQKQYIHHLPVIMPTAEEQVAIKERYARIVGVVANMQHLQKELHDLLDEDWV